MWRQAVGIATMACLMPHAGHAQAVPDAFPFGEFEIGLNVVEFGQDDIVFFETSAQDGYHYLSIRLSSRLDPLFAAATQGKIGYTAILRICGRKIIDAKLMHEMNEAGFRLSGDETIVLQAEQLLRNPVCSDL